MLCGSGVMMTGNFGLGPFLDVASTWGRTRIRRTGSARPPNLQFTLRSNVTRELNEVLLVGVIIATLVACLLVLIYPEVLPF